MSEAPLILAHRGWSKRFPENTVMAFEQAMSLPIDGLELDVQLSEDGVPVIMHDPAVERTTDGTGLVRSLSAAEIGQLNAAHLWTRQNVPVCPVPTLAEVLRWARNTHPDALLNLELKVFDEQGERLVDQVLNCLEAFPQLAEHIVFSSFNHACLTYLAIQCPQAKLGYLYGQLTENLLSAFSSHKGQWVNLRYDWTDRDIIRACRDIGAKCCVWTVDDEREMRTFFDLGVDIIITNVPDVAVEVRERWSNEVKRNAGF